jgi:hypothetical protein
MTVTVGTPAGSPLSANDYLLGRDEYGPDLSKYALPWSVDVNVHVRNGSPIEARVYDDEDRITVKVGAFSAQVLLYLPADQIDRLIALLTAARQRLR